MHVGTCGKRSENMGLTIRKMSINKTIFLLAVAVAAFITVIAGYYFQERLFGFPTEPPRDIQARPHYLYSLTGGEKSQLVHPVNVAACEDDNRLYVADVETKSVLVFNKKNGKFLFSFGEKGRGPGRFNYPYGLALIPEGKLWVSDPENATIQEFDREGKYLRTIHSSDYRIKPGLMAVDGSGKVYVSELAFNRLVIFDYKGKFRGEITAELQHPQGICFDSEGILWVVDELTLQVKKLKNNEVIKTMQLPGSLPMGLVKGLAIDNLGRVFLTQVLGNRVVVLDQKGQVLFSFGDSGGEDGKLMYPMGIAIAEDGKIYVTDRGNGRVMVWGYPE